MLHEVKMPEPLVGRWPGKSAPAPGLPLHPAAYHMLDVAAVAERLVAPFALDPALREALVLLTALHDLGKIGTRFRAMILEGTPQGEARHWQVTEALLGRHDALLGDVLKGSDQARSLLYASCAGHHGRPPEADWDQQRRMLRSAGQEASDDAGALIRAFSGFWPAASLDGIRWDRVVALSWWLPGFVAAADWIGSNAGWFPPRLPYLPLSDYLDVAREQAVRAVEAAGLAFPSPSSERLFGFEPRPMQVACGEVALCDGPMLAFIEDETGAGKTEAALILAQRMMLAGKGRGLFVGLPTMATADAMFSRLREAAGRLFAVGPSLTLAHGRAGLSVPFRDLKGTDRPNPDEPGCADWLRQDHRRALLADVGVGTVDQALMGVLPVKHGCLRLFGLSSKILIVDEVHELGDPYMEQLLLSLLRGHASLGGSAILMTATLPLGLRARLARAFEEGAGRTPVAPADPAYPALTVAGGEARTALPRVTGPRGVVAVARLSDPDAAVDLLRRTAETGAACVWVRNSVDEAIAAVETLRAEGVAADLLHARFALADRKRHEAAALARFGKDGRGRAARVLVATQVVEASLDLDFDVMVSDLAPMAALIQRAGRLWRHMDRRPASTRPVADPVLHVLSPDPDAAADAAWLTGLLGRGAPVYPLPLQWRTAQVLFATGGIEAPAGLRALIEAAHGEEIELPPGLAAAETRRLGEEAAQAGQGARNVVDWAAGFRAGAGSWQDAEFPTRLGQPMRRLMLARRQAGALVPWAEGESFVAACQLSEVQASVKRLAALPLPDQTAPEILALTAPWAEWLRAAVTVCPVDEAGVICEGLRYDPSIGLILKDTSS